MSCLSISHRTLGHWISRQKSWHGGRMPGAGIPLPPCPQELPLCTVLSHSGKMRRWRPFAINAHSPMTAPMFVGADLTSCHIFHLWTTGLQKGQAIQAAQTWIRTCCRTGLLWASYSLASSIESVRGAANHLRYRKEMGVRSLTGNYCGEFF